MQKANTVTLQLQPMAVTSAEDTQGWAGITDPVSDTSSGLPGAPGGAGFVSQWGYVGFFYSFFTQLTEANNQNVDMNTVATLASSSTEGTRVLFTENHDMVCGPPGNCQRIPVRAHAYAHRVCSCVFVLGCSLWQASQQNHGRIPNIVNPGGNPAKPTYWALKKSLLGMGVVLTAPGIPLLLQGQEMLTYATFEFPSPPPLDWSLVSTNAGVVQAVTDMIALRTNRDGTSLGLTGDNAAIVQVIDGVRGLCLGTVSAVRGSGC